MREALRLARRGLGRTSPNPAVGCVLVRRGRIVGRGWHKAAGEAHAEVMALRSMPSRAAARGATAYVTLEPCCTHGRTPPCTAALVEAGISRVVAGTVDPNPAHSGRGLRWLARRGLAVTCGVLAGECQALNPGFNKWITTGLPWVVAKAGLSLDGRLTRPPGEGPWITSEASRRDAMRLRARVDAVLVGAGTARIDNPRLTLRQVSGRQPWRVVWSPSGSLPEGIHLLNDSHRDRTWVLRERTIEAALRELGRRGITSVLIEGGGRTLGTAFDARLVDQVVFYLAPLLAGGEIPAVGGDGVARPLEGHRLAEVSVRRLGDDLRLEGKVIPLSTLPQKR